MNKKYLLDTNVCIFLLQDKFGVADQVRRVGRRNCYVSELTIAELLYGYAFAQDPRNEHDAENIQEIFHVQPIYDSLKTYAATKAYLRRTSQLIDEFDMLIGSTAVHHGFVMVTENTDHFERIPGIEIENWVERPNKK